MWFLVLLNWTELNIKVYNTKLYYFIDSLAYLMDLLLNNKDTIMCLYWGAATLMQVFKFIFVTLVQMNSVFINYSTNTLFKLKKWHQNMHMCNFFLQTKWCLSQWKECISRCEHHWCLVLLLQRASQPGVNRWEDRTVSIPTEERRGEEKSSSGTDWTAADAPSSSS